MSDADLDYHGDLYMWVHGHGDYPGDIVLSLSLERHLVIDKRLKYAPYHKHIAERSTTFADYLSELTRLRAQHGPAWT